jgi:hypothetical protein
MLARVTVKAMASERRERGVLRKRGFMVEFLGSRVESGSTKKYALRAKWGHAQAVASSTGARWLAGARGDGR